MPSISRKDQRFTEKSGNSSSARRNVSLSRSQHLKFRTWTTREFGAVNFFVEHFIGIRRPILVQPCRSIIPQIVRSQDRTKNRPPDTNEVFDEEIHSANSLVVQVLNFRCCWSG